jgi:hypothetical protein
MIRVVDIVKVVRSLQEISKNLSGNLKIEIPSREQILVSPICSHTVMPLDVVSLKLGFESLCPPRLRIDRYATIAAALMEVISRLLPDHIMRLSTIIATVWANSNDAFDLI